MMKFISGALVFVGITIAIQPIISQEYTAYRTKKVAALCHSEVTKKYLLNAARTQALKYIEHDSKNTSDKVMSESLLKIEITDLSVRTVDADIELAECNAEIEMNYQNNRNYHAEKLMQFSAQNGSLGVSIGLNLNDVDSLMLQSVQNSEAEKQ